VGVLTSIPGLSYLRLGSHVAEDLAHND
jgi:hypothetical protein